MTSHTDVIVIGSGGLGAAIAFHLVKRGVKFLRTRRKRGAAEWQR